MLNVSILCFLCDIAFLINVGAYCVPNGFIFLWEAKP